MPPFERLRYALYVAAVGGAAVSLAIALLSTDVVGVLPPHAFDLLLSPLYPIALYLVGLALTPVLAKWFPIKRSNGLP